MNTVTYSGRKLKLNPLSFRHSSHPLFLLPSVSPATIHHVCAGRNPVSNKTPYKECYFTEFRSRYDGYGAIYDVTYNTLVVYHIAHEENPQA